VGYHGAGRAHLFQPAELKAGVDLFGVAHGVEHRWRSIPPSWESVRQALYQEDRRQEAGNSSRLRRLSALFHADKDRKTLAVLGQGRQRIPARDQSRESADIGSPKCGRKTAFARRGRGLPGTRGMVPPREGGKRDGHRGW